MPADATADSQLLDRAIKATHRPRLARLLASPARLGISKAIEVYCRSRHTTVPRVATTFWGEPFNVVLPERVSMTIFRYGYFEEELSRMLVGILEPGMTFYDVGAHFGYFSLLAARLVGPGGSVHSFEPTPSTFQMLRTNVGNKPNVTLNNAAAYSSEQTLTFNDFGVEYSAFNSLYSSKIAQGERARLKPSPVRVRALRLDDYIRSARSTPDFMKIDAEGAELDILKGLTETLKAGRTTFTLEVGDIAGSEAATPSRAVVDFMLNAGYSAHEYRNGALHPHTPTARYTYQNLLFRPPGA